MSKALPLTTIIAGLCIMVLGFQNCGSEAEFSNQGILSKTALENMINNDASVLVSLQEENEVITEMKKDLNEDPKIVEEPLSDVMDEIIETDEIIIRDEAETYECKLKNGKSYPNKKYMLCHVPKGNYSAAKTLCLPNQALKAHLKHFEKGQPISYMGPCKK